MSKLAHHVWSTTSSVWRVSLQPDTNAGQTLPSTRTRAQWKGDILGLAVEVHQKVRAVSKAIRAFGIDRDVRLYLFGRGSRSFDSCAMRFCRWYLVIGFGLGITATGLIFLLAWRDIFDVLVTEEKSIRPGTALYKEWRRPTARPVWQVYVYNWTNAEAVLNNPQQKRMASFRELGPYTFEECTEVVDVKFHPVNGTLSYRKRTFFRRNGPTVTSAPEELTTVNLVALQAAHRTRDQDYAMQRELSFLMHNHHQQVIVTRSIDQVLFGGHREPMYEQLRKIVCGAGSIGVPCQDERFAYFRTFNVSRRPSELYSLDTGAKDHANYGVVRSFGVSWNATDRRDFSPCAGFAELTGEFFPSRINRSVPIRIVVPELCRRLQLVFEREQLVDGVPGYRYAVRSQNETLLDETIAGCPSTPVRMGRYGILNTNECNAMSVYAADPESSDAPQQYLVLEPTTGTVLESYLSSTYHTFLRTNEHIALLQHVPEVRIPLFRFVRFHRLGPVKVAKLKQLLHLADVGHQAALAGCIVGLLIILLTIVYTCCKPRKPANSHREEYRIIGVQLSNGGRETQTLK
uniref:Scavenger receptor class B n=1 Tax=Anopheles farauti TaxID=69004 RepID=A0A182QG73_9DIPT